MPSFHFHQGSVCLALMETQVRLLGISTIQRMAINPSLMAARAINSSVLLLFSSCKEFYLGHLAVVHYLIRLALLCTLAFHPPSLPRTSSHPTVNSIFPILCLAMPHERGKSWCGPTYYNWFGRHKRLGPTSLTLIPSGGSDHSPSFDQNWHEAA